MQVTILRAVCALLLLYGIRYILWQLTVGARRRAMAKEHGCLPPPQYPTKDPILGLDIFFSTSKAFKEKRALEVIAKRFDDMGVNTMSLVALGRHPIATIEPENLKTIQSLKFKDWSLGKRRRANFTPLIGHGIFTSNGEEWQHSRDMLRPNFVRNQIGDVATFETHVSHLIDAIPRDGETVDLQDLFFRLTMDSATEFLIGESTNCLQPGLSTVSASKFAKCFNHAQQVATMWNRYGKLSFLVKTGDFYEEAAFVQGECLAVQHIATPNKPRLRGSIRKESPLASLRTALFKIRFIALHIPRGTSPPIHRPHQDPQRATAHPARGPGHHRLSPLERLVDSLQASRHLDRPARRRRLTKRRASFLRAAERPQVPPRGPERVPAPLPRRAR